MPDKPRLDPDTLDVLAREYVGLAKIVHGRIEQVQRGSERVALKAQVECLLHLSDDLRRMAKLEREEHPLIVITDATQAPRNIRGM